MLNPPKEMNRELRLASGSKRGWKLPSRIREGQQVNGGKLAVGVGDTKGTIRECGDPINNSLGRDEGPIRIRSIRHLSNVFRSVMDCDNGTHLNVWFDHGEKLLAGIVPASPTLPRNPDL